MPLYEYEHCEADGPRCGGKFTLWRPLSAPPLTKCPACKKPVRKVLSTFNSPRTLSISDAKRAGFTVFKRLGKGEYERQQPNHHLFLRDENWPTNQAGYVEFYDPTNVGAFYPWALWVLSITDTNDANHNGIPDFSDDPVLAPPRAPRLSLAATSTILLLTISGDVNRQHNVLQAPSLNSGSWQTVLSLTLTNDPQVVPLPRPSGAPSQFWRVTAQ